MIHWSQPICPVDPTNSCPILYSSISAHYVRTQQADLMLDILPLISWTAIQHSPAGTGPTTLGFHCRHGKRTLVMSVSWCKERRLRKNQEQTIFPSSRWQSLSVSWMNNGLHKSIWDSTNPVHMRYTGTMHSHKNREPWIVQINLKLLLCWNKQTSDHKILLASKLRMSNIRLCFPTRTGNTGLHRPIWDFTNFSFVEPHELINQYHPGNPTINDSQAKGYVLFWRPLIVIDGAIWHKYDGSRQAGLVIDIFLTT